MDENPFTRGFLVLSTALDVGSFSVLVLSSHLFYLLYLRSPLHPPHQSQSCLICLKTLFGIGTRSATYQLLLVFQDYRTSHGRCLRPSLCAESHYVSIWASYKGCSLENSCHSSTCHFQGAWALGPHVLTRVRNCKRTTRYKFSPSTPRT